MHVCNREQETFNSQKYICMCWHCGVEIAGEVLGINFFCIRSPKNYWLTFAGLYIGLLIIFGASVRPNKYFKKIDDCFNDFY